MRKHLKKYLPNHDAVLATAGCGRSAIRCCTRGYGTSTATLRPARSPPDFAG